MPDFLGRGHDQPTVSLVDETAVDRQREEKALAWLRAILKQTEAKMITAYSLERALNDAPEEEVADLLQQKAAELVGGLYNFEGSADQVKHSEDAVQVYLAFIEASIGMTTHEFRAVEHLHHELVHHFSQLPMLKPRNAGDELTISYLERCKRKFDAAQGDFILAKENVELNETYENGGEVIAEEIEAKKLTEEETKQVDLYKRDLGYLFYGYPPGKNELAASEMMARLRQFGQEQVILDILQNELQRLSDLWIGELAEQTHHDVRYWYELLVRQEATFKELTHLSGQEKTAIDSWFKEAAKVKPALEERMVVFATDPEIQLEDKMDEFKSAIDKSLYEPETSSFEVLKQGIEGLHQLGREDIVLLFLKDELEDSGYSVYKDSTLEIMKKWLQRARILKSWLPSLREIATPGELVVLSEYEQALLRKEERVQGMLVKSEAQLEKEVSLQAELTAEQDKLLGLLKRHEGKLEKSNEVLLREEEVGKLEGRLYLQLTQAEAVGLGKTINALNKMGRGDLVTAEIIRRRQQDHSYFPERSTKQLASLHSLMAELTPEQMREVDKWDEVISEAVAKTKQPYEQTEKELEEYRKEQQTLKDEMLSKFRSSLYDSEGDVGFVRSWLYSLQQYKAYEDALWTLKDVLRYELEDGRLMVEDGSLEECDNWLEQRRHLLEVFRVIDDIATKDDKAVVKKYNEEASIFVERVKARRAKLLGLVQDDVRLAVQVVEKKEKEMSGEERKEIVIVQLSLGSIGYAKQLIAQWWPENKNWFREPELKMAAQKGINKQWLEKPLMRPILAKFITEFELQTPVELKPVRKSKKVV